MAETIQITKAIATRTPTIVHIRLLPRMSLNSVLFVVTFHHRLTGPALQDKLSLSRAPIFPGQRGDGSLDQDW